MGVSVVGGGGGVGRGIIFHFGMAKIEGGSGPIRACAIPSRD